MQSRTIFMLGFLIEGIESESQCASTLLYSQFAPLHIPHLSLPSSQAFSREGQRHALDCPGTEK